MSVTVEQIKNALEMALEDEEPENSENVTDDELIQIRKRFISIIDNTLMPETEQVDDGDEQ